MAVRLIVTITAAPGKGSELAQLYKARCIDIAKEPGCEQFEVFQSVSEPRQIDPARTLDRPGRLGRSLKSQRDSSAAAGRATRRHDRARRLHVQSDAVARRPR